MVNLVDDLGPELDPLTLDKNSGANLERQVGMELLYDLGYSGGWGSTKGLPTMVLNGEVEERVGGGKTPL